MTRDLTNTVDGGPLVQLLPPDHIDLELDASDQFDAIRTVALTLEANPAVRDIERVKAELLERERAGSTALSNNVAIPHCRSDCVSEIVMAAGRSRTGIWFENAKQTVHLIFVIATPKDQVSRYLETVGRLARLCRNRRLVEQLLAASTKEDFRRALQSPA